MENEEVLYHYTTLDTLEAFKNTYNPEMKIKKSMLNGIVHL